MDIYYFLEAKIPFELEGEITTLSYSDFNCTGIEEFSIEEKKVDEILGERSYSGGDVPSSVIDEVEHTLNEEIPVSKFYFSDKDDVEKFRNYLLNKYQINSTLNAEESKDWNEEWKKNYKPILVSDKLEIIPEWEKETYQSSAGNALYIYPGMGFGTGSHETTYLCLKLFLDVFGTGKQVKTCLDFGAGSGILGLAVNLLDNKSNIDLYDICEEAINNSKQNIALNELDTKSFRLILPVDREELSKSYDLVFANILQNVLLLESGFLSRVVSPGGHLILSGLLAGQEKEVVKSLMADNPNLKEISTIQKGDWVAVLLEN